ncbi:MAG: M20 family metallopeptidase [Bacillota bacterium]|nr:M20 family metallopeptidase [Bacillota bacterium]
MGGLSAAGGMKQGLLHFLHASEGEMISLLERVVNVDSGTGQVEGLNQVADIYRAELERSGVRAEIVQAAQGNHVLGRRPGENGKADPAGPSGKPAISLVIGHMDTVFPAGTVAQRPFRIEGRCAFGPGVEDMKSGLVCAVFAARALEQLGLWPGHDVRFFFNADEEVRSPTSAHIFAREGGLADEVYVLEGARDDGSVVTARKGSARFQLTVSGRPSHSGANHAAGRSAVKALAHKILELEALTDYGRGITVNVGVVRGGMTFNTVPAEAWCDLDVRVPDPEIAAQTVEAVRRIAAAEHVPGTTTRLEGGITRPPMVRTDKIARLFLAVRGLAALIGRDLTESTTGGGSDGCLTAAAGAPTLDGLGPKGGWAHTPDEYLELDSLVPCAALLAMALATGPHVRRA